MAPQSITLECLLRGTDSVALTRRDCFILSAILASSFLQLNNTPWLHGKWDKRNILFHLETDDYGDVKVLVERPYIHQEFEKPIATQNVPETKSHSFNTKASIRSFGILLLELCFGKPIEKHRAWAKYLGPNNVENDFTRYCVADVWQDEIFNHEPLLESPIKQCIACSFGMSSIIRCVSIISTDDM
jgi:hypothetical protein